MPGKVEEQINSRPSKIRPAKRARFPTPPRNALIERVDQRGDMVISIPAILRPKARLVDLLSLANADPAWSLNLFGEIIVILFVEDPTGNGAG